VIVLCVDNLQNGCSSKFKHTPGLDALALHLSNGWWFGLDLLVPIKIIKVAFTNCRLALVAHAISGGLKNACWVSPRFCTKNLYPRLRAGRCGPGCGPFWFKVRPKLFAGLQPVHRNMSCTTKGHYLPAPTHARRKNCISLIGFNKAGYAAIPVKFPMSKLLLNFFLVTSLQTLNDGLW
jgi:hypothetical protein